MKLDANYWENRYHNAETGWDIGAVSTPLKVYFEQLVAKDERILLPGAGNGHEAAYLFQLGFTNVHILDISAAPLRNFQQQWPAFPKDHIIHGNFFEHKGRYDLIIEQTFFCALDPQLRKDYVKKMHELLDENGKLAGLLFDDPHMPAAGPPFGGTRDEYVQYFKPYFTFCTFEKSYNSIPARSGRELFMVLKKKTESSEDSVFMP